jgi:hypothetical protein
MAQPAAEPPPTNNMHLLSKPGWRKQSSAHRRNRSYDAFSEWTSNAQGYDWSNTDGLLGAVGEQAPSGARQLAGGAKTVRLRCLAALTYSLITMSRPNKLQEWPNAQYRRQTKAQ